MLQSQRRKITNLIATKEITEGITNTVTADVSNSRSCEIIVNLGLEETTNANNTTVKLEEGDTTDASNLATVFADVSVDLETARNVLYKFQPRKKLVKLTVITGTTTGGNVKLGASLIEERLLQEPDTTSDMVAVTTDVVRVR